MTPKQERFAQEVASGKLSQADAYRAAYGAGNMAPKTLQEKASRLMATGKVRARVGELRAPLVEKAGITLESHLEKLSELRDLAQEAGQHGAAITAEVARGKAAGVTAEQGSPSGGVVVLVIAGREVDPVRLGWS